MASKNTKKSSVKEDKKDVLTNKKNVSNKTNTKTKKTVDEKLELASEKAKEVKEKAVDVKEKVETKIDEKVKQSKKSLPRIIFDIVFWIVIALLAVIWIVDFVNIKSSKEPKFCIKKVMHQYTDGTVEECKGLGYNVYQYNRTGKNIKTQFSPFFIGIED